MHDPCGVAAETRVSDSVAYVRAFPMQPRVPQPHTLYPYFAYQQLLPLRHQRTPLVADQPDTT